MIGRKKELEVLQAAYESPKSEFVAVYGRRRVGKTFLIREAFAGRFVFQVTGLANASNSEQLLNFSIALSRLDKRQADQRPANWILAFHQLSEYLEALKQERKVIFIDELPWFDVQNAGFLQALEHFWNSWASARKDVLLVVCGSAASWMINKLINSKGGLHNRVNKRIRVAPFSLAECEQFMLTKNAAFSRYQIAELYMALGGIPFYWEEIDKSLSTSQNIEALCFTEEGLLRREFGNLFSSLFNQSEKHEAIVRAIASKSQGLTRSEIMEATKLPNNGRTTELLNELEESGFMVQYTPFGRKTKNSLYQLTDFYVHFYLKFIERASKFDQNSWTTTIDHPARRAWSGYAFEQLCLAHTQQIKQALGISGIQTSVSSWRSALIKDGAQVDLVIDRRDGVVNLCEMKFSINTFAIDKHYDQQLHNKLEAFKVETGTTKSVYLVMVTSRGLQNNQYAAELVQKSLTLNDLFQS